MLPLAQLVADSEDDIETFNIWLSGLLFLLSQVYCAKVKAMEEQV
jgi:hypothetical protein